MLRTVEMRWFFEDEPAALAEWFRSRTGTASESRTDWYAAPCDDAWSVKLREGRFETKMRSSTGSRSGVECVGGLAEAWCKWSAELREDESIPSPLLDAAGWIPVVKQRWPTEWPLRDLTAENGDGREPRCRLEFTALGARSRRFWTLGFELSGARDGGAALDRVLEQVVDEGLPVENLREENCFGYPHWLNTMLLATAVA